MGFRTFPGDSRKKQLRTLKACCPTHLEQWDCACSRGCPMCWIAFKCTICGLGYTIPVAEELVQHAKDHPLL